MNDSWDYHLQPLQDGETNMRLDESIARRTAVDSRPRIRMYSWNPPTVSLGYNQKLDAVDPESLHRFGFGLVRRPTGGRAVLHSDEITYAVSMPIDANGVHETYRRINQALARGLLRLGAENIEFARHQPDFKQHYSTDVDSDNCFSALALSELMWHSRKLCGSAQRRYDTVLLQHGSLLLDTGHLDIVHVLSAYTGDANRQNAMRDVLSRRTVTLREILGGRLPSFAEIADALRDGFGEEFQARIFSSDGVSDSTNVLV